MNILLLLLLDIQELLLLFFKFETYHIYYKFCKMATYKQTNKEDKDVIFESHNMVYDESQEENCHQNTISAGTSGFKYQNINFVDQPKKFDEHSFRCFGSSKWITHCFFFLVLIVACCTGFGILISKYQSLEGDWQQKYQTLEMENQRLVEHIEVITNLTIAVEMLHQKIKVHPQQVKSKTAGCTNTFKNLKIRSWKDLVMLMKECMSQK